jgi:hypothetical protein
MAQEKDGSPHGPIVAGPGSPPFSAVGTSLVIHVDGVRSLISAHSPLRRRTLACARRRAAHLLGSCRAKPLSDFPDAEARSPDRPAAPPVRPLRTTRHAGRIRHRARGIECMARGLRLPSAAVRARQPDPHAAHCGPEECGQVLWRQMFRWQQQSPELFLVPSGTGCELFGIATPDTMKRFGSKRGRSGPLSLSGVCRNSTGPFTFVFSRITWCGEKSLIVLSPRIKIVQKSLTKLRKRLSFRIISR